MVSIITPTFNAEKTIIETYNSINAQTCRNWEWLVTDDCSTDSTWSILSKIAQSDNRVKIRKNHVNAGAAFSRNESLKRVSGEFIAFIDADDIWVPDKLTKQLDFMGDTIDFSFTAYETIDENGMALGKFIDKGHTGSFGYEDMLRKRATLGCSTVMLRRNAFSEIVMPNIRTGQDYALWLKLLRTGKKAHLLSESLTKYRILQNSISRNKFKKALRQWEIYRKIERLSLFESIECFFWYAVRAVAR